MIGHVTLTTIDPDRPASHSRRIIDGIIRGEWNYQGVIITDDLVMGAIYQHNVCTAVVEALNAGVDLLLVAFDGSQFYRIFACASNAFKRKQLDMVRLGESELRLQRANHKYTNIEEAGRRPRRCMVKDGAFPEVVARLEH